MIDECDMKIISLLEENGRATLTQLANSLGVTDNTVSKRMNALLDNNVITINAVPELHKMGYKAQAAIAMSVASDKIDSLSESLVSNPNMYVFNTIGYYNLVVLASFLTWDELHQFLSSELSAREGILNMEVCSIKQALRPPFKMLLDSEYNRDLANVDDVDRKIIQELSKNGRYSASYLANILNISVNTVAVRINRLLDNQLIWIRCIRNPSYFGDKMETLIFLKSNQQHIRNIISNLRSVKEARGILIFMDTFDCYVRLVTPNSDVLYNIIKNQIGLINGLFEWKP